MINENAIDSAALNLVNTNNNQEVQPLEEKLRFELETALNGMCLLFEEVKEKRTFIQDQSNSLKNLINELKEKKILKEAELLEQGLDKSLNDYYALSDMLSSEIVSHVSHYKRYIDQAHDAKLVEQAKQENSITLAPLRPVSALPQEIKLINSYVKNRKKDLSVIFSRYDHGLRLRLRNFQSIESSATPHHHQH